MRTYTDINDILGAGAQSSRNRRPEDVCVMSGPREAETGSQRGEAVPPASPRLCAAHSPLSHASFPGSPLRQLAGLGAQGGGSCRESGPRRSGQGGTDLTRADYFAGSAGLPPRPPDLWVGGPATRQKDLVGSKAFLGGSLAGSRRAQRAGAWERGWEPLRPGRFLPACWIRGQFHVSPPGGGARQAL